MKLKNTVKKMIDTGEATFVLVKGDKVVRHGSGNGVKPMLAAFEEDSRSMYKAEIYDKVIGKAAAMICVSAEVSYVWGKVMSLGAREYLTEHGVLAECETSVDFIENRTKDDMCPLEKAVRDISDPQDGIEAIRETIKKLMARIS